MLIKMNPINLIQNYRENYSVKYVPRNLRTEVYKFNLKRKITDKELGSVLDKRIEVLKAETEMWKENTAMAKKEIELIKIEKRIAKYEQEYEEKCVCLTAEECMQLPENAMISICYYCQLREDKIKKEKLAEEEWKNQTDIVKESSVEIKPEEECQNPEECSICELREERVDKGKKN